MSRHVDDLYVTFYDSRLQRGVPHSVRFEGISL